MKAEGQVLDEGGVVLNSWVPPSDSWKLLGWAVPSSADFPGFPSLAGPLKAVAGLVWSLA